MSEGTFSSAKNQLLAALPQVEYARLQLKMEAVALTFRDILYTPSGPIEYIYFPNNSVISLITPMGNGEEIEVATLGNEGMLGLPVFLGSETTPLKAIVQIAGDALRMQVDVFRSEVTPDSALHSLLQLYTQALFSQISQSAACNRLHCVQQRFCRWLLMTYDRVGPSQFMLTQEFLALMLGVRRTSVSEVAHKLQEEGLIRYSRGKMTVLDPKGLESLSCECYGIVKQEFNRLLS
ncbi:cAMP-binding proteins - catabolite gene activator and regulatory subunit of cAMP-dependent protein kinases [uncultured Synechococcales cyanobacterium]|uniref:cAMP-binding proteins - catabolite gene activator and regulatory subunit of cAMP-dependent protein kinases n=1 Tax=uncultured Synechococcales cyanobacterium TaxID=1936017 RepID=A0A6J4VUN8_9CYAN|nr:cAMP-binding proteins - catabolite gene activator and regulatory subunit of cAMP-dependent protein kinases [uncultured Synechococcales cyanobacterium]